MQDTIFALSSGRPPAGIGVIRISGPLAGDALLAIAGSLPEERTAVLRTLRSQNGAPLDQALVLWFSGPNTATGEALAELHCHGGAAILAAVTAELASYSGLREALPGEFTRRAFENGRIDLAEAEALGDLLTAETELQRLVAQGNFGGALSGKVEEWRSELIRLSAQLEALMDFADEDDVAVDTDQIAEATLLLAASLSETLDTPSTERLRDGVRVVLAGPPNAGKSSLFNALLEDSAALVSHISGTTRDVIERPIAIDGVPVTLVDTAGVHEHSNDEIERMGIDLSRREFSRADIVLWLGEEGEGPADAWEIEAMSDIRTARKRHADHVVSAVTSFGISELKAAIAKKARSVLPKPGATSLNKRQRHHIGEARALLSTASMEREPLLIAENLRRARVEFDAVTGRTSTEDMLDNLFSGFCIGK